MIDLFYHKMFDNVSGPPDPPVNCTVGEPDPFKVNLT